MGHKQIIPCHYFQRGMCKYGKSCKFEHKNISNTSSNEGSKFRFARERQPKQHFQMNHRTSQQCKLFDQCVQFPTVDLSIMKCVSIKISAITNTDAD